MNEAVRHQILQAMGTDIKQHEPPMKQQQAESITKQIARQQAEADNPDAWWLPSQPSIMTFYKNFRERGI